MNPPDPKTRFTDRVADYLKYRPDYPSGLMDWLYSQFGVTSGWRVADVGAGTGLSSRHFLERGHEVVAVEPNDAMRAAAQAWLGGNPRFRTLAGSAEATGLPDASVDLVSVAQAFHWFDSEAVRGEWRRILRPGGLVVIYWNSRRLDTSPFLVRYEQLLRHYGTDYTSVAERYADDTAMRAWFGGGFRGSARFDHRQRLDFTALRGRLLSSSYAPQPGHPRHDPMIAALRELFETTAEDGFVSFDYDTRVFAGSLGG